MGVLNPFSPKTLYCPYCGAKVVRGDNYCHSCRREFSESPVESSQISKVHPPSTERRDPKIAAFLPHTPYTVDNAP